MIIGLTGLKRSGKSTAAEYLEDNHGFRRVNFKDALVSEMLDRLPSVLLQLKEQYKMDIHELFIEKPPIMRALMQNYGTEVRRGDDPNYWVKRWLALVDGDVVADDVRFKNEAQTIADKGGVIVRIVRHDQDDDDDQHQSEVEQSALKADFTVYAATGQHGNLYQQLEKVIHEIKSNVD